jgi:hypothetical protein
LNIEHVTGRIEAVDTRLPITNIDLGALQRTSDGSLKLEQMASNPNSAGAIMLGIRAGTRSSLVVYVGPHGRYVCCDDIHAAVAYKQLQIERVPCLVLGAEHQLPEGGLVLKHYGAGEGSFLARGHNCVTPDVLPSIYRPSLEGLAKFCGSSTVAIRAVRAFQRHNSKTATHWHYILLSVCERVRRILVAARLLLSRRLLAKAAVLARTIYELAITFHLDCLAPEFAGRYLQSIGDAGKSNCIRAAKALREDRPSEIAPAKFDEYVQAHLRMINLCTSPASKASIAPVGVIHGQVYPVLSGIAHQEFNAYAAFVSKMDNPKKREREGVDCNFLCSIIAVSATAILTRVMDDVGVHIDAEQVTR